MRDFISLREGVARSWGCVSAIDSNGPTIWIADVHRGDGKRFRCAHGWKADCVCWAWISDS